MQENFFTGNLTPESAMHYAKWLWMLLAGFWVVLAFATKRTKRTETPLQRIWHLAPLAIGFWFLFGQADSFPWLRLRLIPNLPVFWWAGLLLTAVGIAISIWARLSLGSNWSGTVTLKDNHELIRNGLYSRVRHPIYTGILLGVFGTGMIHSQLRDLLGFLLLYISFYFKARREESFLQHEFGDSFGEHRHRTGMFLPKLF